MDLKLFTVSPSTTLLQAIEKINSNACEFVVVVNERMKVLGTITDGDIRRAILHKIGLHQPVKKIMNPRPITVGEAMDRSACLQLMKTRSIRHLPKVTPSGKLLSIVLLKDLIGDSAATGPAIVVLMAGGRGRRLSPLTHKVPKPMLSVGKKPILQIIIEQLREAGLRDIFISINYKWKHITSHFGDGGKFGVGIRYLREKSELGTAGALGLLPSMPAQTPILVMNGDVLTQLNFQGLIAYHEAGKYDVTVAVKEYEYQVPYGVVGIGDDYSVSGIDEKPVQRFFVNAGTYVLSPSCLAEVRKERRLDMTAFLEALAKKRKKIGAFPIHEYWLDIGLPKDFEKANEEYKTHFNKFR